MIQKFQIIERASELTSGALLVLSEMDQNHFPTPWSKEDWDHVLSAGQRLLISVEENKIILGFALFDVVSADSFAHLFKIVVTPDVRGKGIGKNLLIEALKVLKERDIKKIFLEVEEYNTHAIRLYESLGFKIIHKKKHFYSSGATALIMTLDV
ncbi:MAG: ribosomal protein S18-alanine N-acetyltransferase [Rhizobacter sp.]|nr:ribosomal protein S18-alanine N-acetyltransferase [Bacteriovorax sp.]